MDRKALTKLRNTVVKLGEDYPDAQYQRVDTQDKPFMAACNYTTGEVKNGPEGQAGCIVGQAANLMGDDELIAACAAADADGGLSINDILDELCPSMWDEDEYRLLRDFLGGVQRRQDDGETWGTATGVTG